jgi:hypothetical protein
LRAAERFCFHLVCFWFDRRMPLEHPP